MPQIIVRSDRTGKASVRTEGFAGVDCQEASRPYEQAVGKSVKETFTAEATETAVEQPNFEHGEG